MIHAAGSPGFGVSARPKALVVLVKMKRLTFAATDSSRRFSVPVTLVSMNSWRLCEPTWGLCSVAVCRTASMPSRHAAHERTVDDRADDVGEGAGQDVEPDDLGAVCAQHAHEAFAEVAGAAGDQDAHGSEE